MELRGGGGARLGAGRGRRSFSPAPCPGQRPGHRTDAAPPALPPPPLPTPALQRPVPNPPLSSPHKPQSPLCSDPGRAGMRWPLLWGLLGPQLHGMRAEAPLQLRRPAERHSVLPTPTSSRGAHPSVGALPPPPTGCRR